ncbi:hypothetical protein [Reichenbachiella agariperforans]|uniref:Uncharacterized protein n=1 Tax=Reichenbachiella agariperforans TaxID=156994 RepID=A0A1M6SKQ5_REIAG|nr:hypothetical protein [Reichenbachiella agariperforans]MBU2916172.1 hypothetical protein [Reichenbachiella agariperforans]SHK45226.1 hypothetical protein SAMN04488028_10553 [Reichenbachiella agariperforans]
MYKRILLLSVFSLFICFTALCQEDGKTKKNKEQVKSGDVSEKHAFHIHQHVMITKKDGAQVEAVIHGHLSRKTYWVREWHGNREGKVKEKYMRPMTEQEVATLKK